MDTTTAAPPSPQTRAEPAAAGPAARDPVPAALPGLPAAVLRLRHLVARQRGHGARAAAGRRRAARGEPLADGPAGRRGHRAVHRLLARRRGLGGPPAPAPAADGRPPTWSPAAALVTVPAGLVGRRPDGDPAGGRRAARRCGPGDLPADVLHAPARRRAGRGTSPRRARGCAAAEAVAALAGPGLGGTLVQVLTAPIAVLADAASFLASALLVGKVRSPERVGHVAPPRRRLVDRDRRGDGPPAARRPAARRRRHRGVGQLLRPDDLRPARRLPDPGPRLHPADDRRGHGRGRHRARWPARWSRPGSPARIGRGRTILLASAIFSVGMIAFPLADGPRWLVLAILATNEVVVGVGIMLFDVTIGAPGHHRHAARAARPGQHLAVDGHPGRQGARRAGRRRDRHRDRHPAGALGRRPRRHHHGAVDVVLPAPVHERRLPSGPRASPADPPGTDGESTCTGVRSGRPCRSRWPPSASSRCSWSRRRRSRRRSRRSRPSGRRPSRPRPRSGCARPGRSPCTGWPAPRRRCPPAASRPWPCRRAPWRTERPVGGLAGGVPARAALAGVPGRRSPGLGPPRRRAAGAARPARRTTPPPTTSGFLLQTGFGRGVRLRGPRPRRRGPPTRGRLACRPLGAARRPRCAAGTARPARSP